MISVFQNYFLAFQNKIWSYILFYDIFDNCVELPASPVTEVF